ncbi:50S ribosomal protein L22 [Candidatus Kaiserbacteria bacterium]|nr:50S ribosomal protein L22 [Candidatus Kaiserbacteria bacterium]NCT01945.1 50S ribosomal protein L22 [Candidatus Parcubacteria bacterium]
MKAILKNYRQSPRKVRLIADLVRGKSAADALTTLRFVDKRAAQPFAKLIESAIANAKQQGADLDKLIIKSVQVNKAPTLKRFMPRARGSASRINKRNSHLSVELGEKK